jgi:hypothetical protein
MLTPLMLQAAVAVVCGCVVCSPGCSEGLRGGNTNGRCVDLGLRLEGLLRLLF